MGEAVLSRAATAARWLMFQRDYARASSPTDHDAYVRGLDGWAAMYVEGWWPLEKLEAHADAMREAMFARSPQP